MYRQSIQKNTFDFIPVIVFILKISAATCSVFLTVQYMRDLGAGTGNQLLFSILGVIFDASKLIFPTLAVKALYEYKGVEAGLRCLLFSSLAVCLTVLSGMASFQSLENSGNALVTNSSRYYELSNQIDELKIKEDELSKVNYKTKAENLRVERYLLINERNNLKPESTVAKYWTQISVSIAALIELVSIALVLATSNKRDKVEFISDDSTRGSRVQVTQVAKVKQIKQCSDDIDPAVFVASQIEGLLCRFDNKIQQKDLIVHGIKANGTLLKQALNLLSEKGLVFKHGKYWQVVHQSI